MTMVKNTWRVTLLVHDDFTPDREEPWYGADCQQIYKALKDHFAGLRVKLPAGLGGTVRCEVEDVEPEDVTTEAEYYEAERRDHLQDVLDEQRGK